MADRNLVGVMHVGGIGRMMMNDRTVAFGVGETVVVVMGVVLASVLLLVSRAAGLVVLGEQRHSAEGLLAGFARVLFDVRVRLHVRA